jgi:XTP/dITP diphosphohydrolase
MTDALLLATTNPGKLAELSTLLAGFAGRLVAPADLDLDLNVPEDGPDYAANAGAKASGYALASGLWALGDDTGLEVDALGGLPGLRSARLAARDADRRTALLGRLTLHPRPWTARFRCSIVLASPQGELAVGHGACEGEVIPEARGTMGFGYDPIFVVQGGNKTMAELTLLEKNRLSHRALAYLDLLASLQRRPLPGAPRLARAP